MKSTFKLLDTTESAGTRKGTRLEGLSNSAAPGLRLVVRVAGQLRVGGECTGKVISSSSSEHFPADSIVRLHKVASGRVELSSIETAS